MEIISSFLKALEVYINPLNLCFCISESEQDEGRFRLCITMGPAFCYRPVFGCNEFFGSRKDALENLKMVLENVRERCEREVLKPDSALIELQLTRTVGFHKIDQSKVLNEDRIKRIIEILTHSDELMTHTEEGF